MSKKSYYIYKHTNKSNGKVYIGKTRQTLNQRWKNGDGYKDNEEFYKDIQEFGWDGFEHEVLFEGLAQKSAATKERKLIKEYDSANPEKGYNISDETSKGRIKGSKNKTMPSLTELIKQNLIAKRVLEGFVISDNTLRIRIATEVSPTASLLYIQLLAHYDPLTKECHPTIEELVRETGISKRQMVNLMKGLSDNDFVHIDKRGPKGSYYTFLKENL